jgi:activator of 2-hydroxyglutaryl-CoA dehydratase
MANKQTPTVIGIDIGSYTAKLAAVQRGAVEIITN